MAKTWLGTSIADLCNGKGLWSFNENPIIPSRNHKVLYEIPVTLGNVPQPHRNKNPKIWDDGYVRMPYSDRNIFPVEENGIDVLKIRWNFICDCLIQPISNSHDFEKVIHSYNTGYWNFESLHYFFEESLEEEESEEFFRSLLPKIINLALQLPEIVPGSIPLLQQRLNLSVSFSQYQIACLLANAFLCTFPWKKEVSGSYPGVNFARLFALKIKKRISATCEKLKCILHYFRRILNNPPTGVVTFERKFFTRKKLPRWDVLTNNLGNTRVHISSTGTIEDEGEGFLQVDFANKNIGGGVLGYGSVQEEIRFVICPELIIARLFVEQLDDAEAIVITGVERFSKYSGYSDNFKWDGNYVDTTPFDIDCRRKTSISVIDATRFNKSVYQFNPSAMLRELSKAYVGFSSQETENIAPVATGNWGCGAFKGDPTLKSLIQLMACNAAHRDLVYFSFGNVELKEDFYNMYLFIASNGITTCELWRILCKFASAEVPSHNLYSFIQQSYFDSKNTKSITKPTELVKQENNFPDTKAIASTSESCYENFKTSSKTEAIASNSKETKTNQEKDDLSFVRECRLAKFRKPVDPNLPKKLKENHDEIIKLMEGIDDKICTRVEEESTSFLNSLDNVKKKPIICQNISAIPKEENLNNEEVKIKNDNLEEEQMDIEFIDEQKEIKTTAVEKMDSTPLFTTAKRKITDYFFKSNKS